MKHVWIQSTISWKITCMIRWSPGPCLANTGTLGRRVPFTQPCPLSRAQGQLAWVAPGLMLPVWPLGAFWVCNPYFFFFFFLSKLFFSRNILWGLPFCFFSWYTIVYLDFLLLMRRAHVQFLLLKWFSDCPYTYLLPPEFKFQWDELLEVNGRGRRYACLTLGGTGQIVLASVYWLYYMSEHIEVSPLQHPQVEQATFNRPSNLGLSWRMCTFWTMKR